MSGGALHRVLDVLFSLSSLLTRLNFAATEQESVHRSDRR
jgi:hypothetical protein